MSEDATLVVRLPKVLEKQLRAHYDEMVSTAIERVLEDKELYKPMVRIALFLDGLMYQRQPFKNGHEKECLQWSLMG